MIPTAEIVVLAKRFYELGGCKGRKAFKYDILITPTDETTCVHWNGEMPEDYIPILTESELWDWLKMKKYRISKKGGVCSLDITELLPKQERSENSILEQSGGRAAYKAHKFRVSLKNGLHKALYTAAVAIAERSVHGIEDRCYGNCRADRPAGVALGRMDRPD